MSDFARDYVKHLENDRVPSSLKVFLFFIADYHDTRKGCAWPGIQTVAEDMGKSVRQIQRLLKQCRVLGIISYTPGDGRGRLGKFVFPELERGETTQSLGKGDIKGDTKGDISGSVIRKEPLTSNQSQNHHSCAALKVWLGLKEQLKSELSREEWRQWVRPMYLLREMSGRVLLLAVPPNGRIMQAVNARRDWLRARLQPLGYSCVLTRYPSDYELKDLGVRFPEHFAQLAPALQARVKKPAARAETA